MSRELRLKEQSKGLSCAPVKEHRNVGYDAVQPQKREKVRFNCSTEEIHKLEDSTVIELQQNYNPKFERSSMPQNPLESDDTRNDDMTEIPGHNSEPGIRSSLYNSKDSHFDTEECGIESNHEKFLTRSGLGRSDRSAKMMKNQIISTQRESLRDMGIEPQPTYSAGSQEDEIRRIRSKNNSGSESVSLTETNANTPGLTSGQNTPMNERNVDCGNQNPRQYNGGILSSIVKLYSIPLENLSRKSDTSSSIPTSQESGILKQKMSICSSNTTAPDQDGIASMSESHTFSDESLKIRNSNKGSRRGMIKRLSSATLIESAKCKLSGKLKLEDDVRITIHIAETQTRQNYLLKLCHALMACGAPTHRLEEYLRMSARVLEVHGSFLYIPGCMIVSFDDTTTHTNEVKLVKTVQGMNLGHLVDIHEIYKEVIHDVISIEEATQRLDKINSSTPDYSPWALTIIYGFASAFVAPWAFQGRYVDMPICFLLGGIVGFLQHVVAPKCELYNNVFEVVATIITSFLARAFGSIQNGNVFCFSAMAQASLALILPGYIILCGSLEIQSKFIVPGGVRLIHGIIYSFFLGFGISIGTAFYGLLDPNATNATTCRSVLTDAQKWVFVPIFALCAALANQARWKQLPVMMIIGFTGYIVNFLAFKRFPSSAQISNTLGALAIGLIGNFYTRMRLGVSAAALLPALFVLVPSGIAASGSLLAGLSTADKITNGSANINGTSIVGEDDSGFHRFFYYSDSEAPGRTLTLALVVAVTSPEDLSKIVFNVGYTMVQVAIGLTVGLFMSTLLVYPFGKRRSGLFAF